VRMRAWLQVEERMSTFVREYVLPVTTPGLPSLVFGHGMAIKCMLRHVLGSAPSMSRRIRLDNTSITELGWEEGEGWHVLRVNDTQHLQHL
jgi:broad specificity phosphatase PhoE